MVNKAKQFLSAGSWYSVGGPMSDVALSTRVRLARNLANFPFPFCLTDSGKERINSIVSGSFSRLQDAERYQFVPLCGLDKLGARVFAEWGLIKPDEESTAALIISGGGNISCRTNSTDHIRMAAFLPGLDCTGAYKLCHALDEGLQQDIQFAAAYDFGYLSASVSDTGSGMKVSVRVHLPCLALDGRIPLIVEELASRSLSMSSCYGAGGLFESALGAFYQISTVHSFSGSEFDQLAAVTAAVTYVAEKERAARDTYVEQKHTVLSGVVHRYYGLAKYSAFVDMREAVEIISALKLGVDSGLLGGMEDSSFVSMLYRICTGNLEFVIKKGSFSFEKDVDSTELRVRRLRAEILKEELKNITG